MRERKGHFMRRRGVEAVEFALTLPIVMILLSGIIDSSWFLMEAEAVAQAAREGARAGATAATTGDGHTLGTTIARRSLTDAGRDGAGATVNPSTVAGSISGDDYIRIEVRTTFTPLVGFFTFLPAEATATTTMRWQG